MLKMGHMNMARKPVSSNWDSQPARCMTPVSMAVHKRWGGGGGGDRDSVELTK